MKLATALVELLVSDTALLSLLGEDGIVRIFPMIVPQKRAVLKQMPCIVYTVTGEDRTKTYCGTVPMTRAAVQFDSYGVTLMGADGAFEVSAALRRQLLDYRGQVGGVTISDVELTNSLTAYDMEPGLMRVVDLYSIWYTED